MRVEDGRKEGDIFHIVLPQPLSQGKHLLHAHLGQLPGKHAALQWGTEKGKVGQMMAQLRTQRKVPAALQWASRSREASLTFRVVL